MKPERMPWPPSIITEPAEANDDLHIKTKAWHQTAKALVL
jgi:hypothetical protein